MVLLYGCKSTKLVPKNKHLLIKNKIVVKDTSNNVFNKIISNINNDQAAYIRHKPNRKILFLGRFYLKLYNFGSSKKKPQKNETKKWRKYLRKIGEAPVILDTFEIQKSENNIKKYLYNKGYYNCTVESEIKYKRKKAKVTYIIQPNVPFTINKVTINADDYEIDKFINQFNNSSLLKPNDNLDIDNVNRERNRITSILRNNGYYDFGKEFIDFELDTINKNNKVDINISISNMANGNRFIVKTIRNIVVYFENDEQTHYTTKPEYYKNIEFRFNGYPLKPYVVAKSITFNKFHLFKQKEVENTYSKLSELPIFKFIEIKFIPNFTDSINGLDAIITLKTNLRQSFTIEPQGIISQLNRIQNTQVGTNSYGIANSLIWTHRNLFKNAELLEISSNTRMETQLFRDPSLNQLFYTNFAVQQGISAGISIPKSALLKDLEQNPHVKSIKTNINISYLYEYNPDYVRKILPLTFQYQIQTKLTSWFLNIAEVSFSRNNLNISLNNRTDSAFITRIFQNNLITASGLSFIYSNKNATLSKSSFFIRGNLIELGGNIHRLLRRTLDNVKLADTSYQLFKVNYFQYAKSEIDARCSTILNDRSSTALRLNIGLTYPYGNQKEVAFDKLFFIGGANSLRGWRPRTIGPGSYIPASNNFRIDRAGDLIIQANVEYRFQMIAKKLEGAFFIDAGNVWIMRDVNNVDESKLFKLNKAYQDIAANAGLGLRIDFQFFLFRLDYGFQIHNPELEDSKKLIIKDFARNQYFTKYGMINFGIGYPF